jgi:hypothetical protein
MAWWELFILISTSPPKKKQFICQVYEIIITIYSYNQLLKYPFYLGSPKVEELFSKVQNYFLKKRKTALTLY